MKFKCTRILAAIFSRLLFSVHEVIMLALVIEATENYYYSSLLLGVLLLFIEMTVTLSVTKNGEWKWFSPMIFIYLCTIIPIIFAIELNNLEIRMNVTNLTISECTETVYKENSEIVQSVEELTIMVLIIGRWLMPRGKMSRDQLAQLLLMYLALGADILDILQLIKEPSVNTNKTITVVGLCLFTWAVMQFTIVLTQTWSSPPDTEADGRFHSAAKVKTCILSVCCTSEVWSVIITVGMQDGPFLIYRLYLITREEVFSDSMIFFICKNILSVILQIYRVVVFFCKEHRKRKKFNQSHTYL